MVLSKVALYCLESNPCLTHDIMFTRTVPKKIKRYIKSHVLYENTRKNPSKFYQYTKMSVATFDYIVEKLENILQNNNDNFISVAEKVFLTLSFLSSEESCAFLAREHGLGRSTVSVIVYRTLRAMWKILRPLHMPKPTTELLRSVSSEFYLNWQFPNCVGCISAKHFYVYEPQNKSKDKTIMLQGISDADYKFIAIEVIDETEYDEDAVTKSKLLPQINSVMPPAQYLPYSNAKLPHILIGDEEYPLKLYLLRPYPLRDLDDNKRCYNTTLRKPMIVIYRAFYLLIEKWCILKKPIKKTKGHAMLIAKVACLLYNVIRDMDGDRDKDFQQYVSKVTLKQSIIMTGIRSKRNLKCKRKRNNRYTAQAKFVRETYKKYFTERT